MALAQKLIKFDQYMHVFWIQLQKELTYRSDITLLPAKSYRDKSSSAFCQDLSAIALPCDCVHLPTWV